MTMRFNYPYFRDVPANLAIPTLFGLRLFVKTKYTGWPKSRYTVIILFFMRFEVTSSALYVAQK